MSQIKNIFYKVVAFLFTFVILFALVGAPTPTLAFEFKDVTNRVSGFFDRLKGVVNPRPVDVQQDENSKFPQLEYVPGEVLVKYKTPPVQIGRRSNFEREEGGRGGIIDSAPTDATPIAPKAKNRELSSWYKVKSPTSRSSSRIEGSSGQALPDQDVLKLVEELKQDPNVEYAEPNYILHTQLIPNDTLYSTSGSWGQSFPDMWGLKKINAEKAWDETTGSSQVIVGVIDTGIDYTHPDLVNNVWTNTDEIQNNGIDDDSNGFVDDYYGWDFANNDNNPLDDHGHGTHVAGTVAAVGNNNQGLPGLSWNSKVMGIKAGGHSLQTDHIIASMNYAADNGAKVISMSLGGYGQSVFFRDAVNALHSQGLTIVVAAGNESIDSMLVSPASFQSAITVGATDNNDQRAYFSNFGVKLDIMAPGVDILSTRASAFTNCPKVVQSIYCTISGTSMATPHVSGIVALMISQNPSLNNEQIRQILRRDTIDLGNIGRDNMYGYGRVDLTNFASEEVLAPYISSPNTFDVVSTQLIEVKGWVKGSGFQSYKVQIGEGYSPTSWQDVQTSNIQPINESVLATVDTTTIKNNVEYTIRLVATDNQGKNYYFEIYDVKVDGIYNAYIKTPSNYVAKGVVNVEGIATRKSGLPFDITYTLEWAKGDNPQNNEFTNQGITLVNNGQFGLYDSTLGTWDTSSFSHGDWYTLRLTVSLPGYGPGEYKKKVKIDQDLVNGWPKVHSCFLCTGSPQIVDLDGDGDKEVLYTTLSEFSEFKPIWIYAYNRDGTVVSGFFPHQIPSGNSTNVFTVEDLDNDNKKEIIYVSLASSGVRKIYVLDNIGNIIYGWPSNDLNFNYYSTADDSIPTVADLDNDGKKEIIFFDYEGQNVRIWAYKKDGSQIIGFPKSIPVTAQAAEDTVVPAASVADMDGDGNVEIAIGVDKQFYLLDNGGNILPGWPFNSTLTTTNYQGVVRPEVFHTTPTFADTDGDGDMEVHVRGNWYLWGAPGMTYHSWEKDSSSISLWGNTNNATTDYLTQTDSILSGDIGDNDKDSLITFDAVKITLIQKDKNPVNLAMSDFITRPLIGDMNGDKNLEILVSAQKSLKIHNFTYGAPVIGLDTLWERNFHLGSMAIYSSAASDMNSNGKIEMAVPRWVDGNITRILSGNKGVKDEGFVYLWEIPNESGKLYADWPMTFQNSAKTGRTQTLLTDDEPFGRLIIETWHKITDRIRI